MIALVLKYTPQNIAMVYCGHLGKTELDAVALANSWLNMTGFSIIIGYTTACDTLFTQIYGSDHRHKLGVALQRALLIITISVFPCLAIQLNIEPLLILMGQDSQISKLSGQYMLYMMPALVAFAIYETLEKYLICQNLVVPSMLISLAPNTVSAILHYVFLYVYNWGVIGSSIAQSISYCSLVPTVLIYIKAAKVHEGTWGGWSLDCLNNWGQFYKLALAGLVMVCIEWWAFEVGILVSGIIGKTELGGQTILMQLDTLLFIIALSVGIAASVRIGHYLGEGRSKSARSVYITVTVTNGALGVLIGIIIAILHNVIPYIYTNDLDVVDLTGSLLPYLSIYMLFEYIVAAGNGILRGSGLQKLGATVSICLYIFVGLPTAIVLMLMTPLKLKGFWVTFAAVLLVESILFTLILWYTNWEKLVQEAKQRVEESKDAKYNENSTLEEQQPIMQGEDENKPKAASRQILKPMCAIVLMILTLVVGTMVRLLR